jgi:ATP-binding cassette subfamily A (ABC1) protein 3
MHFMALCKKRLIYFKRDYKGLICEIVLPIIIITFGLIYSSKFCKGSCCKDFTPADYYSKTVTAWANTPSAPTSGVAADYTDLWDRFSGINKFEINKRLDINSPQDFEEAMLKERVNDRYVAYHLNKIDRTNLVYSYDLFFNTTVPTSPLIGANLMHSAILKQAKNDNSAYIKVRYEGLKLTNNIKSLRTQLMVSLQYSSSH